eukprot:m.98241 g.98241  ORF g.98241 m.98241 type:complete len:200 (-) comp15268_c1_seq3:288-887(-)
MAAFHVLRVDFEPRDKHQADEPAKPQHQFFIRAHTSRKNDDTQFPSSRTLFVANLPLNPEEALSAVFSQFGNIHKCVLSWQSSRHESDIPDQYRNSPNSIVRRGRVQVAHIVYKKAKGVASALSCRFVKNSLPPPNPTGMESKQGILRGKRLGCLAELCVGRCWCVVVSSSGGRVIFAVLCGLLSSECSLPGCAVAVVV